MNFLRSLNDATKKFADYFTYIENKIQIPKNIEENLIQINNNVTLWIEDSKFEDGQFLSIFKNKYKENFRIYNLTPRILNFTDNLEKVVNCHPPNYPSYTLEYLINFSISSKNYISLNEDNVLIIHDEIKDGRIFCLLSSIISYNIIKSNGPLEPISAYENIITLSNLFKEISNNSDIKNHFRYLNYFSSIQKSPILSFKKIYLKNIIITGAPAIDNIENPSDGPYITINNNSFFSPVIRIISNGKNVYCSYKKGDNVEKYFFSSDNVISFDINNFIFGDVTIECLHKGEKSFRQLFIIQFNTFFYEKNEIKFIREDIDSIYKDIRYPKEFFVNCIVDNSKNEILSSYDEENIKWKKIFRNLILKGYHKENNNIQNNNNRKNNNHKIEKKNEDDEEIKKENNIKKNNIALLIDERIDNNHNNTVDQVQDLLNKIGDQSLKVNGNIEEDDVDEDVENYLKSLESK
jgi:hypothetical protein